MKVKYIVAALVLAAFALVSIPNAQAVNINKEQCRLMLSLGDEAMNAKEFDAAKNYYKRAIQYDPWSRTAWEKYDLLVKVVSGDSEPDLSGFDFSASPAPKKEADEPIDDLFESSGGPAFEGC
jgi:tetratricopeptide (TPR) repeat protein